MNRRGNKADGMETVGKPLSPRRDPSAGMRQTLCLNSASLPSLYWEGSRLGSPDSQTEIHPGRSCTRQKAQKYTPNS